MSVGRVEIPLSSYPDFSLPLLQVMASTRSKILLWLLDKSEKPEFLGSRLPSREDVLLVLLHHHQELRETLPEALKSVSLKLHEVWGKANIPVKAEFRIRHNIKSLYTEYTSLKKDHKRTTPTTVMKREIWKGDLQELFDIASGKAELMDTVPYEDLAFLELEREDRQSSSMSSVDKIHVAAVVRKTERKKKAEMRKKKQAKKVDEMFEKVELGYSSSASSTSMSDDTDFKGSPSPEKTPRRSVPSKNQNPMTPALTTTWDRENLSSRQAATSFVAAASALGHDVLEIAASASTVHRMRRKHRETEARHLDEEAFRSPPPLVLHWDGKLIPSAASSRTSEERIAVVLTGANFEELLGVPVSVDGTGKEVAAAVLQLLEPHEKTAAMIIALSFDTTASNSGMISGACINIERALGRPLLWLACRHHIYELLLKDTFELLFGRPSGPGIPFFKRFQDRWDSLNKASFSTIDEDEPLDAWSEAQRIEMVADLERVIRDGVHPREDYRELLQLALLYLGGGKEDTHRFRAPGAYHQARWMAKAIYILKLALFHKQLDLTRAEERGVHRLAKFVSLLYVKFWHEAPIARWAPKNDLDLLQTLSLFPDEELGSTAEKALRRHLWYLAEQGVALAFFDERISAADRAEMINNLGRPATEKGLKRIQGKTRTTFPGGLPGLVTGRTLETLGLLAGKKATLQNAEEIVEDPETRQTVFGLQVVNDSAERGVALIQTFQTRCKDEEQKQFLMKVVQHDRRAVKRTKSGVIAKFST